MQVHPLPAVVAVERLSPRLEELRLASEALGREVPLRVLTPPGFEPTRHAGLPVLWLLHGGFGAAADWTEQGRAEELTDGLAAVVVMPEGGTGGWYADWLRPTPEGPQRWETHHLREVLPLVDARYRTRTDAGGRAIVGLSMGGFGALHHAARHPGTFGFAAAFSGAVDIRHPEVARIVRISPLAHQGTRGDVFGDLEADVDRWREHNPADLAPRLRGVEVHLRTGDGRTGGRHGGGPDEGEAVLLEANRTMHARLAEAGIGADLEVHHGVHEWPYWQDDLAATLPLVARFFEARR